MYDHPSFVSLGRVKLSNSTMIMSVNPYLRVYNFLSGWPPQVSSGLEERAPAFFFRDGVENSTFTFIFSTFFCFCVVLNVQCPSNWKPWKRSIIIFQSLINLIPQRSVATFLYNFSVKLCHSIICYPQFHRHVNIVDHDPSVFFIYNKKGLP